MKKLFKLLITRIFVKQNNKIISKYQPKIIVVVGSIGKTSTKLAIANILSKKYRVQYENGNYNVPLSVPFVLTGQRLPRLTSLAGWLRAYRHGQKILRGGLNYDIVVLEYSIDHVGEMNQFSVFPPADYLVVSAIAPEHMENLLDIETVAKEELKATNYSKYILFNSNTVNKEFINKYGNTSANYQSYGEHSSADFVQYKTKNNGRYYLKLVNRQNQTLADAPTNMIAKHSLDALSAAAVIAGELNVPENDINQALKEFSNPSGRMSILSGKQQSLIIDDSYNSSPEAVIAALDALYSLDYINKIAILGNMNELGDYSAAAHKAVGAYCDPKKIDLVITIGPDANQYLAKAAQENGCQVITTNSPAAAGKLALEQFKNKSAILVKGSQNKVFAEEAIKPLLLNSEDITKLVRQSDYWMNLKRSQFSDIS